MNKTIIWSFYLELKRANSIPSTVNLEGEEKTRGVTLQKNKFLAAKQQLYILESDWLTHSLTDSRTHSPLRLLTNY